MIGTIEDIHARIKRLAVPNWYSGDLNPIVDALLWGLSGALSWVYDFIQYAKKQTRISTATDEWLDSIAFDFFGKRIVRNDLDDEKFRGVIKRNLFSEKGTRKALSDLITNATNKEPFLFEPRNPKDTGGYGSHLGYGAVGGYGSMLIPYQGFVGFTAYAGMGIPYVAGYGYGGYREGVNSWSSLNDVKGQVTTKELLIDIEETKVCGTLIWANNTQ